MRKFATAAILLTLIFLPANLRAAHQFFDEANAKYKAGDYPGAVSLYQKAIESGDA